MNFLEAKKIHFIAIGGIGVSALAKLCHNKGIRISGSDLIESEITKELRKKYTLPIYIGNNPDLIDESIDAIIHSPAVPKNDPEYQKALSLKIPIISYPEALGELSKQKFTIAIAGTNGKTTATAMLVEIMKDQEIHPDVIVGGILQKYNSNFLAGDSKYFITEACEYKRSFLNIYHDIAVITNVTEDHLDYFKNLEDIQNAFKEFIDNKKNKGVLVCNTQLQNLKTIFEYAQEHHVNVIDYSKYLDSKYQVSIPGEHNRQNMATALAIIEALNLNIEKAARYLATKFTGAKRRMEYLGTTIHGALLYDDYAHNPEGIEYSLSALKHHYPNKKIIILFEPHLYSRTEDFKKEFGQILSKSDVLYLFPVYRAREKPQREKDFLLTEYITKNKNFYIVKNKNTFKKEFESKKYNNEYVVITLGAGDIWEQGLQIKKQD